MTHRNDDLLALQASLQDLHGSVHRLIQVIQENASYLADSEAIMDKLPILDFYNDDLKRNIEAIRQSTQE
jgi:methyl-accepting chemotaxis protein